MKAAKSKKALLPTTAEARLLKALWTLKEATVEQIVSYFPATERPNYKTTHTFLRIMEAKGFVSHTASGRTFVFKPAVSEEEIAQASVSRLLKQSFGGSASGLLINLLEGGTLKHGDLLEIEDLIRKYRESTREEPSA